MYLLAEVCGLWSIEETRKREVLEQGKFEPRNLGPEFSDDTPPWHRPAHTRAGTCSPPIINTSCHQASPFTSHNRYRPLLNLAAQSFGAACPSDVKCYQLTSSHAAKEGYFDYEQAAVAVRRCIETPLHSGASDSGTIAASSTIALG